MPFSPPLIFPVWGRGPLPIMPPMFLNHCQIDLFGDVVAHPDDEFQKNPDEQQRSAIIVQHL